MFLLRALDQKNKDRDSFREHGLFSPRSSSRDTIHPHDDGDVKAGGGYLKKGQSTSSFAEAGNLLPDDEKMEVLKRVNALEITVLAMMQRLERVLMEHKRAVQEVQEYKKLLAEASGVSPSAIQGAVGEGNSASSSPSSTDDKGKDKVGNGGSSDANERRNSATIAVVEEELKVIRAGFVEHLVKKAEDEHRQRASMTFEMLKGREGWRVKRESQGSIGSESTESIPTTSTLHPQESTSSSSTDGKSSSIKDNSQQSTHRDTIDTNTSVNQDKKSALPATTSTSTVPSIIPPQPDLTATPTSISPRNKHTPPKKELPSLPMGNVISPTSPTSPSSPTSSNATNPWSTTTPSSSPSSTSGGNVPGSTTPLNVSDQDKDDKTKSFFKLRRRRAKTPDPAQLPSLSTPASSGRPKSRGLTVDATRITGIGTSGGTGGGAGSVFVGTERLKTQQGGVSCDGIIVEGGGEGSGNTSREIPMNKSLSDVNLPVPAKENNTTITQMRSSSSETKTTKRMKTKSSYEQRPAAATVSSTTTTTKNSNNNNNNNNNNSSADAEDDEDSLHGPLKRSLSDVHVYKRKDQTDHIRSTPVLPIVHVDDVDADGNRALQGAMTSPRGSSSTKQPSPPKQDQEKEKKKFNSEPSQHNKKHLSGLVQNLKLFRHSKKYDQSGSSPPKDSDVIDRESLGGMDESTTKDEEDNKVEVMALKKKDSRKEKKKKRTTLKKEEKDNKKKEKEDKDHVITTNTKDDGGKDKEGGGGVVDGGSQQKEQQQQQQQQQSNIGKQESPQQADSGGDKSPRDRPQQADAATGADPLAGSQEGKDAK